MNPAEAKSKRVAVAVAAVVVIAILAGVLVWKLRTGKTPGVQPGVPAAVASSAPAAPPDAMSQTVTDIVARYRKTIVLLDDDDSVPEPDRDKDSLVGKIIFQENHQAISNLSNGLTDEIEKAGDFHNLRRASSTFWI